MDVRDYKRALLDIWESWWYQRCHYCLKKLPDIRAYMNMFYRHPDMSNGPVRCPECQWGKRETEEYKERIFNGRKEFFAHCRIKEKQFWWTVKDAERLQAGVSNER